MATGSGDLELDPEGDGEPLWDTWGGEGSSIPSRVCILEEEHMAVAVGKDISHTASGALHPMRKDGAGRSRARGGKEREGAVFPKHFRSAVVFYFSGVLEWKFAFNPSLTS